MKAANVFLHKDEQTGKQSVKIGDLGVAKLLSHTTAFATTVGALGGCTCVDGVTVFFTYDDAYLAVVSPPRACLVRGGWAPRTDGIKQTQTSTQTRNTDHITYAHTHIHTRHKPKQTAGGHAVLPLPGALPEQALQRAGAVCWVEVDAQRQMHDAGACVCFLGGADTHACMHRDKCMHACTGRHRHVCSGFAGVAGADDDKRMCTHRNACM